jgi:radical SAM protein with 4Fe4S-binding SPASM domain
MTQRVRLSAAIRTVEYRDKTALFNINNSKQYLLLTRDRHIRLLEEIRKPSAQSLSALYLQMLENSWLVTCADPLSETSRSSKLLHLLVELTEGCNSSCIHCYRNSRPDSTQHSDMAPANFVDVVLPFVRFAGTRIVGLTGGEPTIAPAFRIAVDALLDQTDCSVIIYTNGVYMPTFLPALAAAHPERLAFQFSLDGAYEPTSDAIRGEGTFRRTLRSLESLRSKGVRRVSVKMTITPGNAHEYQAFVRLVRGFGYKPTVSILKRIGRASSLEVDYKAAVKALEIAFTGSEHVPDPSVEEDPYLIFSEVSCGLGRKLSAVIDPSCNLLDCPSMRNPIGSLIIDAKLALRRYFETDHIPSVEQIPVCCDCEVRYACAGGCRSIPFSETGSMIADQPYCNFYRRIYRKQIWRE